MKSIQLSCASVTLLSLVSNLAFALPGQGDRVYTADQNSNTVSVIDPINNVLLGQIPLGGVRPDVLGALYKGELNVHGLGFSPDHKSLVAVSNGSNSVTFIDTETNAVKGKAYIGRSPHEAFFTADGKAVWAVVRGEDYISVIDAKTYKETSRIKVANGPGMIQFLPNGKYAFVVSSFSPVLQIIDVASKKIVKSIPVVSPFSPFLQFTPDYKEMWMTHKDVGKITRLDTTTLTVKEVFDVGLVTNHIGFATTAEGLRAYVTVGAENAVKVYSTGQKAELKATVPVGALPHGIWPSDDGSRMYVGLENGDAVEVIDTAANKVIAAIPVGQAPQALVYLSKAVNGSGVSNLVPRVNSDSTNFVLESAGTQGKGLVVVRPLGLVNAIEWFMYKLKPMTQYSILYGSNAEPMGVFKTNGMGAANGTAIGPVRSLWVREAANKDETSVLRVVEASKGTPGEAVLRSR